jgi:neutral ceramidase
MKFLILLSGVFFFALDTFAQSPAFRAAVVKVNITPDKPKQLLGYAARQSTGVYDSIYHRIVVMDDGKTQFYLVSTEICEYSPAVYDHVSAQLQKQLGINPQNFWWSVTHTHSAPEVGDPGLGQAFMGERFEHQVDTSYLNFIERSLISGIETAKSNLQPAKLAVGWGFAQANINRRAIDVDGKASLGLNPDGPVDRRIGLIRLDKADGSPLALLVNYPIHGTVLGQEFVQISGDVAGVVSKYVEEKTGAPVLFINGAAGNLAPIYSVYPNPRSGHLSQFRVLLGDKILDANRKIVSSTDSVKLFSGAITVEGTRKPGLGWPDNMKNYSSTTKDGTSLVRLPVRFLKINNDIGIWSTPLELFCEISNEVRDRSPFPFTFYYGYTNGWLGYLPTEEEFKHGGYEVDVVCPYTADMGRTLTEAVVAYMEGEMQSPPVRVEKKRQRK